MNVSDDKLETAVRLSLLECLYSPNIAEIKKCLRSLDEDLRVNQPKYKELPTATIAADKVSRLVEMVKTGEAKALINSKNIDKIRPIARHLFKEISDETIRRNLIEFAVIEEQTAACHACKTSNYCPSGGCIYKPELTPAGWIKLSADHCNKFKTMGRG